MNDHPPVLVSPPFPLFGCSVMKRTIAAIALALLPAGAVADVIFEHGGHTYKIIEEPADWFSASAAAAEMMLGGHQGYLARIDSESENSAVLNALRENLSPEQILNSISTDGADAPFVWLGGSDHDEEGVWAWSNNGDQFWAGDFNGSPIGGLYSNWGIQPDSAGGLENGLAMALENWPEPFFDLGTAGQWNDLNTDTSLIFVVEFDGLSDLSLSIEEPISAAVHSGWGIIRGWATSSDGVDSIEVTIDGTYHLDIPHGELRNDIANRFPEMEGALLSGFSNPFYFNRLGTGTHTAVVRATDRFGSSLQRSVKFDVTTFDKTYIAAEDSFELGWSDSFALGKSVNIRGALIDGVFYNIVLEWRPRTQRFEIVHITRE